MKKFSKEEKAMWLEDWQRSGKTAWAYAKENGLIPQTFNSWARPRKKTKQAFVEVPSQVLETTNLAQKILIEKGDLKIHIPLEPVLSEFKSAIARLGQSL
jgi:transposase-like protein